MIAVGITLYALVMTSGVLVLGVITLNAPLEMIGLFFPVVFMILGLVLFALSKPLAALIARGL